MGERTISYGDRVYKPGDLIFIAPEYPAAVEAHGRLTRLPRVILIAYDEAADDLRLEPLTLTAAQAGWPALFETEMKALRR
ncbi:hypothetical protein WHT83_06270 [Aminobacter sp. P9b]|uniref:hypothetical protein n=1 Tax=Aminobacter sp. P9b TaxID=3133697 RepID=UPI00325178C2